VCSLLFLVLLPCFVVIPVVGARIVANVGIVAGGVVDVAVGASVAVYDGWVDAAGSASGFVVVYYDVVVGVVAVVVVVGCVGSCMRWYCTCWCCRCLC